MREFPVIVVCTDLSETSRLAFEPALAIASRFASRLVLVHVVDDRLPPFVDEFTAMPHDDIVDAQARRAAEELETLASGMSREGVVPERVVLRGTPHAEIVRYAEQVGAALIAMATHGRGFISHALSGSTAERVVRRAPCPVLTVRGRARAEG